VAIGHAWPLAWRGTGDVAAVALPSLQPRRASTRCLGSQDLFPTNRYIETSGALGCASHNDRKYPLPECRNPNLESQGSPGSGVAVAAIYAGLMTFISLLWRWCWLFSTSSQPACYPAAAATAGATAGAAVGATGTETQARPARRRRGFAGSRPPRRPSLPLQKRDHGQERDVQIVFTNRGAQVKHWILKKT